MLDAPTFPIVLVSNGIHHIVPTKLLTVEKLVDWRLGLALHHLNQARALWSEADLDYMLVKNPDPEFSQIISENLNKLQTSTRLLIQKRANKATGLKSSIDCTHMLPDETFGTKYTFKGAMVAQVRPDLPREENFELPATPTAPTLSTPAPALPSLPAEASTSTTTGADSGTTADNPIIFSSDSEVGSTPVPTSQPIKSSKVVKVTSGYNKGKVTGKVRARRGEIRLSQGLQPTNTKKYKCTYPGCTKAEARKNDLDDHIFVVHKGGKYTCPHCDSSFLRKRTKVSHIKVKHEGQKKCHCKVENCSWSDNDYGKLIGHMFTVHQIGTELKCLHCSKVFQNERSYEYHIIHAHEAKQFQCSKCNRWFKLKSRLEEHWNRYHKDDIPKFMCHICGHSFSDQKNMDVHVKKHSKEDESKANILNSIDNALNNPQDVPEENPQDVPEENPQDVPEGQSQKPQDQPGVFSEEYIDSLVQLNPDFEEESQNSEESTESTATDE